MRSCVMDALKLVALDKDDIEIVSAHVQDSVLKVSDIHWFAADRRLVIGVNRFDWETATRESADFRRRRTALRFDRVLALKCRNLDQRKKDSVLNLLAVEFRETDAPAGVITLLFSDGAALRLEVECLECELADLGPVWTTHCCPHHLEAEAQTAAVAKRA